MNKRQREETYGLIIIAPPLLLFVFNWLFPIMDNMAAVASFALMALADLAIIWLRLLPAFSISLKVLVTLVVFVVQVLVLGVLMGANFILVGPTRALGLVVILSCGIIGYWIATTTTKYIKPQKTTH